MCGVEVAYDLLVPARLGLDFDAVFDRCRAQGYRGLNITYPYKERVVARLAIDDPDVRTIAACNTAVFDAPRPRGLNTDYTGFIQAFRGTFGPVSPGLVAIFGAGGVGKAIGFALARLGATGLRLFDADARKAEDLARALSAAYPALRVDVSASAEQATGGADGLVNCTPLGMVGYQGSAIPASLIRGQRWAFDAVYTPIDTEFVAAAQAAGLSVMSGYELYLYQGIDAFGIFTGHKVDAAALREALAKSDAVDSNAG